MNPDTVRRLTDEMTMKARHMEEQGVDLRTIAATIQREVFEAMAPRDKIHSEAHVFTSIPSSGTGTVDHPGTPPYWHHEHEPCEVCRGWERCEDLEEWLCATPDECGTHGMGR